MPVFHFTFSESFYDIFEFTSKLKQQEKLKNLKKKKGIVSRFGVLKKHAFDIGENVSRWQKRDTIMETLIWMVCYTRQKRVTIYLNRATILGAVVAYLSWRLFWKQGLRVGESQVRFWDLKTARRANSSTFYQFMYVLIPLLIMLFVNSIMSS